MDIDHPGISPYFCFDPYHNTQHMALRNRQVIRTWPFPGEEKGQTNN
jgi:hypothetical protein